MPGFEAANKQTRCNVCVRSLEAFTVVKGGQAPMGLASVGVLGGGAASYQC